MSVSDKIVRNIVKAARAYLPPDGITADEFINRVIEAIDNDEVNPTIARLMEDGA